jgi:hypothetical protein
MAADASRAPLVRETKTVADRLRATWARIEPGIRIHRDNFIERWDGEGEGRASSIDFEGFGLSFILFIGRTPKKHGGE